MTSPPPTDADIVRAACAGDREALGQLYTRYGNLVYRLGLRILGNATEAEDLTQEVFLAFWRGNAYDSQRGSVPAFLATMTRSRAVDRLRRTRSQRQLVQRLDRLWPTERGDAPMENASTQERVQRVRAALQEIPEAQRQVLELAYYNGMSQTEIEQHLGVPLGTVKTRARQGLLKLRRLLGDLLEGEP